ncbi:TPA: hypothetical protein GXZ34_02480 [bacterium]|nr:hypothetical protein [bacterium]
METEITVQVFDNMNEISKKLTEQGYEVIEKFGVKDYYFSRFPLSELENLPYGEMISNSLIVREIIDEFNPKKLLVYKNKVISGDVVLEEDKINIKIDDIEKTKKALTLAGLTNWGRVFNKSTVFKKDEIVFDVQEIEDLGIFIEYEEDESMQHLRSPVEKIEHMKNIVSSLGLKLGGDFSCKKVYMLFQKQMDKR